MNFTLNDNSLVTLRNRHDVGLTWVFDMGLDEDGELIKNEELELPTGLDGWLGTATVYAQGPTSNDAAKIGSILLGEFGDAATFAELDVAAEKIVRAELTHAGVTARVTESRQDAIDPSGTTLVVPVTMTAAA